MKTDYNNPLIWVDTKTKFSEMVTDLSDQKQIGVDTESNSLYVYQEEVCLIQFSTETMDYLVDSLALRDLSELAPIFESEQIEKIFHAAEYDIICLKRDFGFAVNNIFDTMLASRILGKTHIGLGSLLQSYFDVKVNKKYQRANWGQRPLTEEMLNYARQDSHYLIKLRNILHHELVLENNLDLAQEDFFRMSQVTPNTTEKNGDECWRVLKGDRIEPAKTPLLFDLCHYRDDIAQKVNRPPFKVFGNKAIQEIIAQEPTTLDELANIQGFSPRLVRKYGQDILAIIELAKGKEPIKRKRKPKPSYAYMTCYDALKRWRKEMADKEEVESDVILPKDIIDTIAYNQPKTLDSLSEAMRDVPVRFSKFGNEILSVIKIQEDE